jgi:hypothetical protein
MGAEPLLPGDQDPNRPEAAEQLAQRFDVATTEVLRWLDEGLPGTPGAVDPFAAVNWLSWGNLHRCPVLARRWRIWLRWFTTPARPCRLAVTRIGVLHLPRALPVRWWVREPGDAPGQRVLARTWCEGASAHGCRYLERTGETEPSWRAEDEIALAPQAIEPEDRLRWERLVTELAGTFRYGYRRHVPHEAPRWEGTCLDLAQLAGAASGRPWRLVLGVVAHRMLANPHAWIEIEDRAGWVPLDPTLPAVARMLGADWRTLVPLAVGRHDGRRLRIGTSQEPLPGIPGGASWGSAAGEVLADGRNAAACADWALGECRWSIAAA